MSLSAPSPSLAGIRPVFRRIRLPRALRAEGLRYGLVSLIALAADAGSLALLVEVFGAPVLSANMASFALGSLVAYWGSIHWAFATRRFDDWPSELALFVAIGGAGLAVNQAGLWLFTEAAGIHYGPAKALAAGASFLFNFGLRRAVLFRG